MADNVNIVINGEDRASPVLNKASKSVSKFSSKLSLATKSLIGITAGIVALRRVTTEINKSVAAFGRFETGITKVSTLLGNVADKDLRKFSDGVTNIAIKFGQSTDALNAGLFDIISAGVESSKALGVLSASAKLATGGFTDTATATKAVVAAMQIYQGEIRNAADAADFLFSVQEKGVLTVADVANNFGRFADIAKSSNISVEEAGAAFATISKTFVGAERSSSKLEAVFRVFNKVTDEQVKKLNDLGIAFDKDTLQREGLTSTLERLSPLNAQQLQNIFQESEAVTGLIALTSRLNSFKESSIAIREREGKATDATNKALLTTEVRQAIINQKFQRTTRTIGEAFAPAVIELQEAFLKFFDTLAPTIVLLTRLNIVKTLTPVLKLLGFTILTLITGVSQLIVSITLGIQTISLAVNEFLRLIATMLKAIPIISKVGFALEKEFVQPFQEATKPIEENAKLLKDLGTEYADIIKGIDKTKGSSEDLTDQTNKLNSALGEQKGALPGVKNELEQLENTFDSLTNVSGRFSTAFKSIFERALDRTQTFKGAFKEFADSLRKSLIALTADFTIELTSKITGIGALSDAIANSIGTAIGNADFIKKGGILGKIFGDKFPGIFGGKGTEEDEAANKLKMVKEAEADASKDVALENKKLQKEVKYTTEDFKRLNKSKEQAEAGLEKFGEKLGSGNDVSGGGLLKDFTSSVGFGTSIGGPIGALGSLTKTFGERFGLGQKESPNIASFGGGGSLSQTGTSFGDGDKGVGTEEFNTEITKTQELVDGISNTIKEIKIPEESLEGVEKLNQLLNVGNILSSIQLGFTKGIGEQFKENAKTFLVTLAIETAAALAAGAIVSAASIAFANAVAAAWLPAALFASIATFGGATATGTGLLAASTQALPGIASASKRASQQGFQEGNGLEGVTMTFAEGFGEPAKLAEGGLVTKPTLAVVGERGPELVVPLTGGGNDIKELGNLNQVTAGGSSILAGGGMNVNISIDKAMLNNPSNIDEFVGKLSEQLSIMSKRGTRKAGTF